MDQNERAQPALAGKEKGAGLGNLTGWHVWRRTKPTGADGALAADVNAVCFFHMLFCLAVISELFFNICQELKL